MKSLIIIERRESSEVETRYHVRCVSYEFVKQTWGTELQVTRRNGNIDRFISATEVHEVVWKKRP